MARKKGQAMVESTDEPVDDLAEAEVATVGERLRAAREEKGLSLEDVAAQTRIPRRHLESLETSDWERLPAPTYTNGFAKSYASVVGLDRVEIGEQLRGEMGGLRPTTHDGSVRARRPGADHAQVAGVRRDRRGSAAGGGDELAQPAIGPGVGRSRPMTAPRRSPRPQPCPRPAPLSLARAAGSGRDYRQRAGLDPGQGRRDDAQGGRAGSRAKL